MRYEGRLEAGRVLAGRIEKLGLGPCVVAGIPRGGVVVASSVAEQLGAPLVAIHARKLSSPEASEFAFGAMDENGHALVDHRALVALGLGDEDVARIEGEVARELGRCRAIYPGGRLTDHLPGRVVIVVDDGLATGLTMRAAVACAQRHGAKATVVAVPCAAERAAREMERTLRRRGDRFVCPVVDPDFQAVSGYYESFPQVSDVEVADLLARATTSTLTRGGRG